MIKLCNRNLAAPEKLPPKFQDKSGIGVHYVDAFIAPMNARAFPANAKASKSRCASAPRPAPASCAASPSAAIPS
jgi:hypothetical protein